QMLRSPHIHPNQLIPFSILLYCRKSFPFQSKDFSTLCTCWNSNFCLPINGRNFHFITEYGIRYRDMQVISHIFPFPLQFRMFFLFYQYDKVAISATALTGIPFTCQAPLHSFLHAGRNLNGYRLLSISTPGTVTIVTLCGNNRTLTITGRTGCHSLHLTKKCLGHLTHLSGSTTSPTCLKRRFIFCSISTTLRTSRIFFYFYLFSCSMSNFFKIHFNAYPQICSFNASGTLMTASGTSGTSTSTKKTAKDILASKNITKI